uniref:Uncharacterized protein n=1 Tax=Rhizophora mucronata TaxID=61149 RepID=A0A2P2IYY3_RHIMU
MAVSKARDIISWETDRLHIIPAQCRLLQSHCCPLEEDSGLILPPSSSFHMNRANRSGVRLA